MPFTRHLEEKVRRLLEMFPAVAVLGPRQCGKSTLVQTVGSDWRYYDLEQPDDYRLISQDPAGFFARLEGNIIIDEAQQYPELFSVLRGVIDQQRDRKGRFLLTGSSSPQISTALAETLAGRCATVELWPFKCSELERLELSPLYKILSGDGVADDILRLSPRMSLENLHRHWFLGGYPEPRLSNDSAFPAVWMDEYFESYIGRDIRRLFPRLNIHRYRLLIQTLSHYSGRTLNHSDIARAIEVSSTTVKDHLDIIHHTFIWRNLLSYGGNPLKKVQKAPRGFYRDSGVLHHLLKLRSVDDLLLHPQGGASFEAFVCEEIIRGFACLLEPNLDFFYYRTQDRSEVDLIVNGRFGTIPIEIKLGRKLTQRSLRGLKQFVSDTGAPLGMVVNTSDRVEWVADKILQVPATLL